MTFDEALDRVRELLQQRGRVTYRSLKLRYQLDDEVLAGVTDELISAERVAVDEDGKVLVWIGTALVSGATSQAPRATSENEQPVSRPKPPDTRPTDGERRQLTVMFIDLVGSTTLSQQLDPEDYHARVVVYQTTCRQVIARYEGHIAQYLGDGVLVYFGYPAAHEDDAVRAVHSGLEIVMAVSQLAYTPPLQVRIGIHTGLVVVGEIGAGERTERLALGETPNLAARVQGQAEPNTVLISQATSWLVQGFFTCEALGPQSLKNVAAPLELYRVYGEGEALTRFEVSVQKGLTPLVGRESELGLLRQGWKQAKAGAGHVVLLSGEPGIGKSRLVQELKERVNAEGATRIEFRCSPYHQNSALYPVIDHLQRLLQFAREDAPTVKLEKLQHTLSHYRFPQADTVPLLASLLSLPHPTGYPPITVSPQKQKEKTQAALVAWLVEEAEQAAVFCAWEDLHWADPSTLELLTLFLEQIPAARVFTVFTFRPDFTPPWNPRSYLSQFTLNRLGRTQVEAMVEKVTGGKALPADVVQQIVAKTDGVPLFVEELTKTVVETIGQQATGTGEQNNNRVGVSSGVSSFRMGVPSTLQDALMARLDRLGPAKKVAQLGATIGREFSYELLHVVARQDEGSLQQGLRQLVDVELLYQRGLPPHVTYLFKHALIQDMAYQSLLKSNRQQLHQQIAQVLEEQFPETKETQPELLAHHYTEAGFGEQAIPYWQQAGQQATQRSANQEALSHLSKGLEVLKTLPDTSERAQQELRLQIALSPPIMALKGWAAPELDRLNARAQELCQQVGESSQLFPVWWGLSSFSLARADYQSACSLMERCLRFAQNTNDSALLLESHWMLGHILSFCGDFVLARNHFEKSIMLYNPQQHSSHASLYGQDPGTACLVRMGHVLWYLGYPDQAMKRNQEGFSLSQESVHFFTRSIVLSSMAWLHQVRREEKEAQEWAETTIAFCVEQELPFFLAGATIWRGWALTEQEQVEDGIAQIIQGMEAYRTAGVRWGRSHYLALLAEAYGKGKQFEKGFAALAEGLAIADETGERWYEAELYRLKGELLLAQEGKNQKSTNTDPRLLMPDTQDEAEACFLKAIEVAKRQQAKSLELRATMSLARLWQQQGKQQETHAILSDIYNWFTEGFGTKDLQNAKALLEELS